MTFTEILVPQLVLGGNLSGEEREERQAGGVYNDSEILRLYHDGLIIINPFDEKRVQNSSVDVTLGHNFYGTDKGDKREVLNMFDPESGARYFNHFEAIPHEDKLVELNLRKPFAGIPLDANVVVLNPQERVLGHTAEAIGIIEGGTTQMQAKSTVGRWGLGVCLDAGWGDEGYVAQWTTELVNMNLKHPIVIVEGMPFAQIIFYKMNPASRTYTSGGHYQKPDGTTLDHRPTSAPIMLPRTLKYSEIRAAE